MKKLISIFYDIRKDEWQRVFLMFGLHFILMVILYFLKPARDSLFLTENGPNELPYVYILLAVISIPVTQFLTSIMGRYSVRSVLIWTLGFLAGNLLLLRWMFRFQLDWIFMAFYVWVGIFGILVISLFWLLGNAVFKPAQSKRIFSFLTLGAILGAIAGSEASSLTVSWLGLATENLLFVCIALLIVGMGITYFIPTNSQSEKNGSPSSKKQKTSSIKAALKILKSRYQLTVAVIIGLTMITTTFTDYQFKTIAFDVYPEKANLTAFMGTFYAGVSLASLAIQVLLSTQIIKKLGLSGAVLSRPAGMMVGAILMAIEPVLASVVILNGFDGATRYSIDKTGRELLFLPLPQHTKEQTKIFIDIFVDRFSRGLGGLMLLGLIMVLGWSVYLLTYVVIALLVIWIILGIRAKRGYVQKFRDSVQKQLISTGSIALDLNESTIYSIIQESLHSKSDSQILHTLFLLKDSNIEKISDDLRQLLNHENREIKLQALKLLQDVESLNLTEEIKGLLEDKDPEIRLETIYYLCKHSHEDPTSVIKSYLAHDDYKLKSAALGCASKHRGSATDLVEPEFFDQLLDQEGKDAVVIKAQIADALGYINNDTIVQKYLSKLLDDEHPIVVRKAISSMGRQKNDRFIPLLIDKLKDSEFKVEVRKTLASYGTAHLILYKDRFFDSNLDKDIRKNIPGIFSYLSEQAAVNQLFDMISIDDPNLRYHVIKALNKLRRKSSGLEMDIPKVRKTIKNEAKHYFEMLAVKQIQPSNRPNAILIKALEEKLDQNTERIFRLLGLIYNPKDMYGTYLSLQSISSDKRSAAVEFLDNILSETDRKYLFPIVDTREQSEKMVAGRQLFDIPQMQYDEGLLQLINGEDQWLHICAIYSVSPQCPANLQSKVKEAAQSSNELIKETAELVIKRNKKNV
ncbi:Npt1/Npt2 family nucleotide transporter [Fodinibius sp.]|uniref:Npt1/Npt2 family nucleotide transporter n=1 Tax=Fodinibius sp. TaxID=1872440 RepID=UPI002ACE58D1|nr:Npt1/Npt2 family nucleotide transporter [Fodinibius sp.]MDZ7659017.1 Npt1/Npt2 family nucleotide transporter [Fodinibius sp.]